jgi:hypothetical protein
MRPSIRFAVIAAALLGAGCAREHLSPAFGRANREAFAAQPVNPAKAAKAPSQALDTQEAEVIARSYVRGLSGKTKAEPEPVLYVSPQKPGAQAALPPSVPKN